MTATPEDWELLGLEPDADVSKVRRAYRERKALYKEQTLATYNLFDVDERSAMLARIDSAYENIIGTAPSGVPGALDVATATAEADVPSGPAPDAVTDPGLHLRHKRLVLGVSLHHVEAATKVGRTRISTPCRRRCSCAATSNSSPAKWGSPILSALPRPTSRRCRVSRTWTDLRTEKPQITQMDADAGKCIHPSTRPW